MLQPVRLPRGANFAFHALMTMAERPGETGNIAQIAEFLGAPPAYMAKLFQRMRRAGLVVSRRGASGGYALGRPAEEVSLWDVMEALSDETEAMTELPHCNQCSLANACPISASLQTAQERVAQVFRQISVAGAVKSLRQASRGNSLARNRG